jgi:hypothetical protein
MSTVASLAATSARSRKSLRSFGSRPASAPVRLLVGRLQLEHLLRRHVLEDGLADRHLGAEAERELLEARALHERAVRRAEIAQDHALGPRLDDEMLA